MYSLESYLHGTSKCSMMWHVSVLCWNFSKSFLPFHLSIHPSIQSILLLVLARPNHEKPTNTIFRTLASLSCPFTTNRVVQCKFAPDSRTCVPSHVMSCQVPLRQGERLIYNLSCSWNVLECYSREKNYFVSMF